MPYIAYIVGGWVQKEGIMCLRNKNMAPQEKQLTRKIHYWPVGGANLVITDLIVIEMLTLFHSLESMLGLELHLVQG